MKDGLLLTPEDCALLIEGKCGNVSPPARFDKWNELWISIRDHAKLVPAPLNGDKVWYSAVCWNRDLVNDGSSHNQCPTVVRAKTKAAALRMLNACGARESAARFRDYWSETKNRESLLAAKEPGVYAKGSKGWVKLWPK